MTESQSVRSRPSTLATSENLLRYSLLSVAPQRQELPSTHEDEFVQRYRWLYSWCLRIAGQEQALDLLHDAFVQFTLSRPDLGLIQNLEAYLYTLLRNLYLSRLRQNSSSRERNITLADFDSAAIGLRAKDSYNRMQAQDELLRICQYALGRKNTSKAGSVLILRFFHGYYPSEVARVLQCPRGTVYVLLRSARKEAKCYLVSSHSSKPKAVGLPENSLVRADSSDSEFLEHLRRVILQSSKGDCFSRPHLQALYSDSRTLDCCVLAHIVCCGRCLDEVNRLLGLPLLSARYPVDMLGPDKPPKDDGGSALPPVASVPFDTRSLFGRARETYEHRPKELRISVNGFVLGSQKIGSEFNQLTLAVSLAEKIAFIEVLSEQGMRLLFLNVEPAPDGPAEQAARVELSDDRTLEATLSFSGPWPTLRVVYHDPILETANGGEEVPVRVQPARATPPAVVPRQERACTISSTRSNNPVRRLLQRLLRLIGVEPLRVPQMLTASVALILVVALAMYEMVAPSVSAAELLNRSAISDQTTYGSPNWVVQRSLSFDEREYPGAKLIARRRIEIWQSAARRVKVRRLFDENDRLIAGEWTQSDGSRKIYRRGGKGREQVIAAYEAASAFETENIWQLEPSANDFTGLIRRAEIAHVEQTGTTYVIKYQSPDFGNPSQRPVLIKATLTLSKPDLHPVEETLLVQQGNGVREYRFSENALTRKLASKVTAQVFEPDPELLGTTMVPINSKGRNASSIGTDRPGTPSQIGLEVEALYRLDQIDANLGNQVSVKRTPEGQLRIEGLVETAERKQEILEALLPVVKNPRVKANIFTLGEALQAQLGQHHEPITAGEIEMTRDSIPVYSELRRYFAEDLDPAHPSGEKRSREAWIETEVREFSDSVLQGSIQANLHALALRDLIERFSAQELLRLQGEDRAHWEAMIDSHAEAVRQEAAILRRKLQPIFFAAASGKESDPQSAVAIRQNASLLSLAGQLTDLASANENTMLCAFTVSSRNPADAIAETRELWRSLERMEELAIEIRNRR